MAADCEECQQLICEHFSFTQLFGKICINTNLPELLKNEIQANPENLIKIKENIQTIQKVDSQNYWVYPKNNENFEIFPDPSKYLIGFFSTELEKKTKKIVKRIIKAPISPNNEKNINKKVNRTVKTPTINQEKAKNTKIITKRQKPSAFSICNTKIPELEKSLENPLENNRNEWSKSLKAPETVNEENEATGEAQKADSDAYPEVVVEEEAMPKFLSAGSGSESSSKLTKPLSDSPIQEKDLPVLPQALEEEKLSKDIDLNEKNINKLYQTQKIDTKNTKLISKKPIISTKNKGTSFLNKTQAIHVDSRNSNKTKPTNIKNAEKLYATSRDSEKTNTKFTRIKKPIFSQRDEKKPVTKIPPKTSPKKQEKQLISVV